MLYGAGSYALIVGRQSSCLFRGVVTLSFTGGCLATVIFYAPMLWSRRVLVAGILGIGLMAGLLSTAKSLGEYELPGDNATRLLVVLQFSVFIVAGVGLLALAIADLCAHGTPNRRCWFFGRWEPLASVGCSIGRSMDERSFRWRPQPAS